MSLAVLATPPLTEEPDPLAVFFIDVIEMVGQQRVSSPAEVVREVERAVGAEREAVLLLVGRSDDRQFITLNLA